MSGLDTLRRTPEVIAGLTADVPADVLRSRPFAGKWTPNEILGHLVDHEIVTMCRIRVMRMDPTPWLASYDQEQWVATQRHNDRDPAEFLRRFRFLRALNLEQYDALTVEERATTHPRPASPGDTITLEALIERHAGHDAHHLDQLRRYLAAAAR